MPLDFDALLDQGEDPIIDPREIFMTLSRERAFAFPRDIQTEVMNAWFQQRDKADTFIKLNVGSGKTLVGLLLLQSSLNEGVGPAIYISPDKQLVNQVLEEATRLGIVATDDPFSGDFQSGEEILVTTVHRLFNGRSIFGVGGEVKIRIGSIVIDDAHACVNAINQQFRIELPHDHTAYMEIFRIIDADLKKQNYSRYLDLKDNNPHVTMEVPYWIWIDEQERIIETLHRHKEDDLKFAYPLLEGVLSQCRCIINGQKLEIEPVCPPTELIKAFSRAKRRIYMTATLADDSVLVTHFKADPDRLSAPIVPVSSQSMGERMILMPQELNPEIKIEQIREMLIDVARKENVVVIVPSKSASKAWEEIADQILLGDKVVGGVEKLRNGHVGLTVLVNRYDGIDLPGSACRVLAIVGLPEVASLVEKIDMAVLGDSKAGLRRQMQRIEQGMGRGIRSNDDYCVVLLIGEKLTRRVRIPEGEELLTTATQRQLDLSRGLARQLAERSGSVGIPDIKETIESCLGRTPGWVRASKQRIANVKEQPKLNIDEKSVAVRRAFDHSYVGDHVKAAEVLSSAIGSADDQDEKAWLLEKIAAIRHHINKANSQEALLTAYRLNSNVVKPLDGVVYQQLSPHSGQQAAAVQKYQQFRFLESTDRLLHVKELISDLNFHSVESNRFESAVHAIADFIGAKAQRPENLRGEGPDNLWAFSRGLFFVIECKNGATTQHGISKADVGQLGQSMAWFSRQYPADRAVPIIIHPLSKLGSGASTIENMRVITEEKLRRLREELNTFAKSLGESGTINSIREIQKLIKVHGFGPQDFLQRYTTKLK